MSDQPPPPKPKPGSLRDRIAAFEKPNAAPPISSNRPPVRPKPGNISWKPAPPSPTSAPPNNTTSEHEEQKHGGMSASDAKESIGRGGSLKERMAALQGKGAFGGGLPGPPPLGPKPVKRPPLVVPPPPEEEGEKEEPQGESKPDVFHESSGKHTESDTGEDNVLSKEDKDAAGEEEQDEETKERERRAAIAARMARLGGARVGMAPPPVFAKKPEMKPKLKEDLKPTEETKEEPKEEIILSPDDEPAAPKMARRDSASGETSVTAIEQPMASSEAMQVAGSEVHSIARDEVSSKESGAEVSQPPSSTTTSPPESRPAPDLASSEATVATSRSPPTFMPLPSVPRRAGPPRKRSARNIKAQSTKEDDAAAEVLPISSDAQLEISPAPAEATAQVELVSAREQRTYDDPGAASESSVTEDKAPEKSVLPTMEEPNFIRLSPTQTVQGEELAQETWQSTEDRFGEKNEEKEPETAFLSQRDADPLSTLEGDDEAALEPEAAEPAGSEHVALPDADNFPGNEASAVETSLPGQAFHDEAQHPVHEQRTYVPTAEQGPIPSTAIEPDPSSPAHGPDDIESSENQGKTTIEEQLEQPPELTTAEETEDEETARRRRIAERMAKMGGRNPFATAAASVRKPSVDEPQEAADATTPETSNVSKDTYDDDVLHEPEVIAEPTAATESLEAEDLGPRVIGVVEGQNQEGGVPTSEQPLEEHEETARDHKISPEALTPGSQEHLGHVSFSEESPVSEGPDNMASLRISRPIPPLPPAARQEDQTVSPTTAEYNRAPVRPLPPPKPTPVVLHDPHGVSAAHEKMETDLKQETHESEHERVSAPASHSRDEQQEGTERHSPPTRGSMAPPPPRMVPTSSSAPTSATQSATSEPSRKSNPPPIPRGFSPTSTRRAVSPPPRAPPVSPPSRSGSIQDSPTNTVRRSIPPPKRIPSGPPIIDVPPARRSSQPSVESAVPPARRPSSPGRDQGGATSSESDFNDGNSGDLTQEQEVLDESEADPIDPSFHSPQRSPIASPTNQTSFVSDSKVVEAESATEEDGDQARRRTIAERMAKLGGIKFGAALPIPGKPPAANPPAPAKEDSPQDGGAAEDVSEESEEPESEEAARARRQAISARLAGMGGMRFGMLPQTAAPVHSRTISDESARTVEAPPQQRQAPPPSDTTTSDADVESEDGVKVDAQSELSMEEVTEEDAVEEPEEVPPPIPSRPSRQVPGEPISSIPGGRPPIPTSSLPTRPPLRTAETERPVRKTSGGSVAPAPHPSDFVVIDDSAKLEEAPPAPPRPRPPRAAPPSTLRPQPTASTSPARDMASSQWELPDIPRGSFDINVGPNLGLDSSITSEDSTTYPPRTAPNVESPSTPKPPVPPAEVQLSADELLQLWNVVGTAVHSAASSLYDKSKKAVIGDGTSKGFVMAALAQVPKASKASYGHLVYSQSAHAVLRRSSNIMPGDIIQLTEAKLKGHKGLQSYNQTVGSAQEPLVAIVSEFDVKKSKVKVYQANQHVGAQTVETTSYRLEDLKSGSIKVFRVASA